MKKIFILWLFILSFLGISTASAQESTQTVPKKKILKVKQLNETNVVNTSQGGNHPANTTPANTTPANTTPANTTPANTTPANTTPANTTPANTTPANTTPANTTPAISNNPQNPNPQINGIESIEQIKTDEKLKDPIKLTAGPKILPPPQDFIEGEIVKVGQIGLLPWENRFGAMIGIERLGEKFYGTITPGMNYKFNLSRRRALSLTLGVPLRFEILDSRSDVRFENAGTFRTQDWDELSDFAKVIQRLTFGGKEQRFYLDVNRFSNRTLGHGSLIKRYDSNLNFNTSRVGLQLDAFNDFAGFETVINDITRPNLVGGLVFIKPLSFIDRKNAMLRSFSIGFSMVGDFRAPLRNDLDRFDIDKDGRRSSELTIDPNTFQPKSLTSNVIGYGVDAEIKLYDKKYLDWKTYVDYSFLETGLPTQNSQEVRTNFVSTHRVRSGGFTWGHLIRSNIGTSTIHAFRARMEYRNYDANYLPSYFDPLYEIQRVQYSPNGNITDLANATKAQQILGRDTSAGRIHGAYLEGNWRYGDYFALAAGLEFNSRTPDNHFFLHLELPKVGNFQFATTYQRRNAMNVAQAFQFNLANNNIWIVQSRYLFSRFLATNLSVMTPFGFNADSSVFRNTIQVNLSVEIGFAFLDGSTGTGQTVNRDPLKNSVDQNKNPASRSEN